MNPEAKQEADKPQWPDGLESAARWIARDEDGGWWQYWNVAPIMIDNGWIQKGCDVVSCKPANIVLDIPWRSSLIQRPQEKPEPITYENFAKHQVGSQPEPKQARDACASNGAAPCETCSGLLECIDWIRDVFKAYGEPCDNTPPMCMDDAAKNLVGRLTHERDEALRKFEQSKTNAETNERLLDRCQIERDEARRELEPKFNPEGEGVHHAFRPDTQSPKQCAVCLCAESNWQHQEGVPTREELGVVARNVWYKHRGTVDERFEAIAQAVRDRLAAVGKTVRPATDFICEMHLENPALDHPVPCAFCRIDRDAEDHERVLNQRDTLRQQLADGTQAHREIIQTLIERDRQLSDAQADLEKARRQIDDMIAEHKRMVGVNESQYNDLKTAQAEVKRLCGLLTRFNEMEKELAKAQSEAKQLESANDARQKTVLAYRADAEASQATVERLRVAMPPSARLRTVSEWLEKMAETAEVTCTRTLWEDMRQYADQIDAALAALASITAPASVPTGLVEQIKDALNAHIATGGSSPIEFALSLCERHLSGEKPKQPVSKPHNPAGLTDWGQADGWRLLDEDEIMEDRSVKQQIEMWDVRGEWTPYWQGSILGCTYRTKLSRADLAAISKGEK